MCNTELPPLRMAMQTLALWLLLLGSVVPQVCCQHWSYGLNPGGKRELDSLSDTLDNVSMALHTSHSKYLFCTYSL